MKKTNSKRSSAGSKISVDTTTKTDLFEVICSDSNTPEKCQRFVDRLQLAATNIDSKK